MFLMEKPRGRGGRGYFFGMSGIVETQAADCPYVLGRQRCEKGLHFLVTRLCQSGRSAIHN